MRIEYVFLGTGLACFLGAIYLLKIMLGVQEDIVRLLSNLRKEESTCGIKEVYVDFHRLPFESIEINMSVIVRNSKTRGNVTEKKDGGIVIIEFDNGEVLEGYFTYLTNILGVCYVSTNTVYVSHKDSSGDVVQAETEG